MKKVLSFILCFAAVLSVLLVFPICGFAAENGTTLPEFDYPTLAYPTLAETGIPYEALISFFPEILEIKHENGILYVKDLGGDDAQYTDRLNYSGYKGKLVDGYWEFEVSSEAYNSGGSISMYTNSRLWHVQYDVSGKRGVVSFTTFYEGCARIIALYPTEGYEEQYVQVIYDLLSGMRVTDTYSAGVLKEQTVAIQNNTEGFWARYDAQGNIKYFDISRYDTGEDAVFIPGQGWSEHSREYIPTDAPTGYENATLESLLAKGPTDIGCEHQWEGPLCDVLAICALCKREKGAPIGHSWVSGNEYDTCSTCNGILYRLPKIDAPSFEGRPYRNLDKAGLDTDAITSIPLQRIRTKYENGVFMIPNIDGYFLDIRLKSAGRVQFKTQNGWNMAEVDEEDLKALVICFSKVEEHGDNDIWYDLYFDADGSPASLTIFEKESDKSISVSFEENTVELSYPKEKNGTVEYTDIYKNGDLASQFVYDFGASVWVYYDADLNVEKVTVYDRGEYVSLIPGKGWVVDGTDGANVPAPAGYENKDIGYFADAYPHNIDFCIHSIESADNGIIKKCAKCGEIVELRKDAIVIVLVAAGAVLAATAGIVIAVKKKKGRKAE